MLTREQLIDVYEASIENHPAAGLDVIEASKSIDRALEDYCTAIQYETFLWAYELGYQAGRAVDPEDTAEEDESGEKEGRA